MILSFAGQKGGSGKSTTAIAVAVELVERGHRVLLVDVDPQGSVKRWGDVAALEGGEHVPTVTALGAGLHRHLPPLAASYDHVLLDCPPRHGELQRAALAVSDLAVLPCGPSAIDAWALAESVDLVREARAHRPELAAVVLITRKLPRTVIGARARHALVELGLPVLEQEITLRVTYQEAPAAGRGPTTYDPPSAAAREVRALATELLALDPRRDTKPSKRRR